jgi:hypothetical protein
MSGAVGSGGKLAIDMVRTLLNTLNKPLRRLCSPSERRLANSEAWRGAYKILSRRSPPSTG